MDREEANEAKSLDAQISKITKSTRTTIPAILPLHDLLRQKYRWYYNWHLKPWTQALHCLTLVLWCAVVGVFVYLNYYQIPLKKPIMAAGLTCTSTGVTADWSTATTWDAGCSGGVPSTDDSAIIAHAVTMANTVSLGTGSITINSGGTLTTNNNTLSITNMTINTGGTLTAGSSTINVSGNWTNNDTFTAGASNVTFNGTTTQTITGSNTWYNLTIANTYGTPSDTYDVDPNLAQTVTNTLLISDGQWSPCTGDSYKDVSITYTTSTVKGIMKPDSGASITISGNFTFNTSATYTRNNETVTFTGSGKTIGGTATSLSFYNVTIQAGASITNNITTMYAYGPTVTVNGTLTIGASKTVSLNNSSPTLTIGASGLLDGTNVANSILRVASALAPTITLTNPDTGNFGSNLYLGFRFASNFTLPSLHYKAGKVEVYFFGPAGTYTATPTVGTLDIDGNFALVCEAATGTPVLNFNNSNNTTIDFGGDFARTESSCTAKYTKGTETVYFDKGSGTQTFDPGASSTFNNIEHSGAGTLQLSNTALNVDGNLTNSAAGTFDANGLNINVAKNWNISSGSFSAGATPGTQTVTFDGAIDQTITTNAQAFNNLTLNNTGADGSDNIIMSGALDVDGLLKITDGDLEPGANNITLAGGLQFDNATNGSITRGAGTLTFDGTGTWTDSRTIKGDLGTIAITGALTLGSSATLTSTSGAGTFNLSSYTLSVSGTGAGPFLNVTTFNRNTSTVKYTGALATTIDTISYHHLQLSGATTYSLGGNLTVTKAMDGDLTIDVGVILDTTAANNYNLTVVNATIAGTLTANGSTITASGNWTNSGTFTGTGTVTFDGTTADQTITPGSSAFNNLIINNTGLSGNDNIIISGTGLDIDGDLTLTDGDLNLGTLTHTLDGNLVVQTAASTDYSTSTFVFNGVGKTISGTKTDLKFYNFTVNSGKSITSNASPRVYAYGDVLINGTMTDNVGMFIYGSNFTVNHTFTVGDGKTVSFRSASETLNIGDGAVLGGTDVNDSIFVMQTDATPTINLTGTGNFDTNLYLQFYFFSGDYVLPALNYQAGKVEVYGLFTAESNTHTVTLGVGTLDIDRNFSLRCGGVEGTPTLDFNNSTNNTTIDFGGDFARTESSCTAKYTPGTETVYFDKGSGTQTFDPGAISTFNNITHSGAGILQLSNTALNVDGNFENSAGAGTFDANGLNVNVAKNWNIAGGSFSAGATPGAQTVTFDGTAPTTQNVYGDTAFNNLTATATTARTIQFEANKTQTINGTLTLTGSAGQLLSLHSSASPTQWNISVPATKTLTYLSVKDSNNTGTLASPTNSTDEYNNLNWFVSNAPTIGTPEAISATAIRWWFTDNSEDEAGFRVKAGGSTVATCPVHSGTGLTSCDETGLSVNTQYPGRSVVSYNGSNESAPSADAAATYTLANTPAGLGVTINSWDATNGNSLTVTLDENGNPAWTEFAIACNSTPDSWLQGDGTCAGAEIWKTKTNWGIGTTRYLKNLPADTDYTLLTKGRNGDNLNTLNSPTNGPNKTAPVQPTGLVHTGNTTTTITWDLNPNPVSVTGYHLLNNGGEQIETSMTSDFVQDQSDPGGTPLTANTQYTVRARAYRGAVTGQPTAADTTAAYTSIETPTGITFGTITPTSIDISASGTLSNLSTDDSGLYFTAGGGSCAAWTHTNSCSDIGLSVNTQYGYKTKARNGDSDETGETATSNKYTYANVPNAPTVDVVYYTSLKVIININANPAPTQFALFNETLGQYVQADGSNGAAAVWQNYATWGGAGGIDNTGLSALTTYTYKIKGLNGDSVETVLSPGTSQTTPGGPGPHPSPTPSVSPSVTSTSTPTGETSPGETGSPTPSQGTRSPTSPSNLRATSLGAITLTLAWDASVDDISVAGYQIYNAETGILVGTTTKTSFDFTGLTPNSTYKFYVRAFDAVPNYSPNSEILTITTLASRTAEERTIEEQGGIVAYLVLGGVPGQVGAGQSFPNKVKVTAADVGGKIVQGYSKAIYFTSTDPLAKFAYPESHPYTFTTSDAGIHEFEGSDFVLNSTGNQQITVSDQSTKSTVDVKVTSATATVIRQTTTYVQSFFTDPNKVSKANIVIAALIAGVIIMPTLLRFLTNVNNLIPQLIYGFTHIFQILGLRRRRKIWGVVFNSQTGQPIPFAMVKLLGKNNQIAEISISDSQGRYGFAFRHGSYHLAVSRADYIYPTDIKTSSFYERVYTGTEIKIADPTHIVFNIALDPHARSTLGLSLWIWLIRFNHLSQKLRLPLLVLGMIFALVMIVINFDFIYFAFLVFCVFVALLELLNLRKVNATGVVTDVYSRPIPGAIVRIYHKEDNRLIDTNISGAKGHFAFKVFPGIYYLVATKPKYIDFKSHLMYLQKEKKKEAISSINIKLRKE